MHHSSNPLHHITQHLTKNMLSNGTTPCRSARDIARIQKICRTWRYWSEVKWSEVGTNDVKCMARPTDRRNRVRSKGTNTSIPGFLRLTTTSNATQYIFREMISSSHMLALWQVKREQMIDLLSLLDLSDVMLLDVSSPIIMTNLTSHPFEPFLSITLPTLLTFLLSCFLCDTHWFWLVVRSQCFPIRVLLSRPVALIVRDRAWQNESFSPKLSRLLSL